MKAYFIKQCNELIRLDEYVVNEEVISCGDVRSCDGVYCDDCILKNCNTIALNKEDLIELEY